MQTILQRVMAAAVLGCAATTAWAQAPAGPVAEAQRSYNGLKANILKAANDMPTENYSFRPTPEVRTFARVVNHISEAQLHSCGALNGTAMNALPKVPDENAGKAAVLQALQASFAACDQAFSTATDATISDMVSMGSAKRSRIGLLWGTVSHDNEQYATLALYMRLKGLLPPSSEK